MRRGETEWIAGFFAERGRDWTPAAAGSAVQVLHAPLSREPEATERCASVLSDAEGRRAERFVSGEGRAQFVQRRAFRRYCGAAALGAPERLSRIELRETAKGRPYLPDSPELSFSFSTCRQGLLGAWSSTHDVGVDLEDGTRDLDAVALARRYFSKSEVRVIETAGAAARLGTFLRLWCLKEAALKSVGEGLPFGLDAFEFELGSEPRVIRAPRERGGPERFRAHLIEASETRAAVVIRSGDSPKTGGGS